MVTQPWRLKVLSEFKGLILVTAGGETWIGRGYLESAIDYFESQGWAIWGLEGFRSDGVNVIATDSIVDWDEDPAFRGLDWEAVCRETAAMSRRHCRKWAATTQVEFVEFNIEASASA